MSNIYDYVNNIYIYGKNYGDIIGILSNKGANPQAPYYDDLFIQELDTGADTFQFSTMSTPYTQDILEIGNHIGFHYNNRFEVFTIASLEYSHYEGYKTIGVYAEGIGFELLEVFMERPKGDSYSSGGNDSDGDGDDNTDDEYADSDDVYIDENGNIIYDKDGSGPPSADDVTIDGDGNIIYRPNKKNNKNDSIEFKNISYPTFLNILLKNSGWSFVCQPGLESVKHNISVRYDTNIYAILQDSMQAYRGVELEFVHEATSKKGPAGEYYESDVKKIVKAYKDGGRGSFVGKRFEYGKNVRGITKTQEVTQNKEDSVIYVDNVGVDVYYDIDFALKSAEIPEIEIGDTHYVIDNDFCPPMTIKARIGKIEVSFSDPTKNKLTVANTKKISGSAVDDEDIKSTVKDLVSGNLDDYYSDDSGDHNDKDCIKNHDLGAWLGTLFLEDGVYGEYIQLGDFQDPNSHGELRVTGYEKPNGTIIGPELVRTKVLEGKRATLRDELLVGGWDILESDRAGSICVANNDVSLHMDILPNKIKFTNGTDIALSAEEGINIEREDGNGAKLSVFGELYATEKIKCELTMETNTLDVNTIQFSDGTTLTSANGLSNDGGNNDGGNGSGELVPDVLEVINDTLSVKLPVNFNNSINFTDCGLTSDKADITGVVKLEAMTIYCANINPERNGSDVVRIDGNLEVTGNIISSGNSGGDIDLGIDMPDGTIIYEYDSVDDEKYGKFVFHRNIWLDEGYELRADFIATNAIETSNFNLNGNLSALSIGMHPSGNVGDYNDGRYIEFTDDIYMPNYNIVCKNLTPPSDRSLKENIRYIDDKIMTTSDDLLDKADLHDFIVNRVNLCEYNFIGDTSDNIGFIANDYEGTKVGDKIVSRQGETLSYSVNNLLFATIGALQEEVRMRDEQIASLEARLAAIEEMLNNK